MKIRYLAAAAITGLLIGTVIAETDVTSAARGAYDKVAPTVRQAWHAIEDELEDSRRHDPPMLGITLDEPGRALANQLRVDADRSLIIETVRSGSPADRWGVLDWDVLTHVNGEPASLSELRRAKREASPVRPVGLTLLRGGEPMHVDVWIYEPADSVYAEAECR